MGKLKTDIAEEQIATDMAERLNQTVHASRQNAETVINQLQEAMKIDKVESDHIQSIKNTIFDIVIAASHCIPGGLFVSAALKMFRQKSVAQAAWILRSGDSEFAQMMEARRGIKANAANTLSSVGGGFYVNNASAVQFSRGGFFGNEMTEDQRKAYEKLQADGHTATMFEQGGHASLMREQFENHMVEAVLGQDFSAESSDTRLHAICLSHTDAISNKHVRDTYKDGGATLMKTTYKRVLGQLREVEAGGASAVLTYALATLVDGIDIGEIGATMANLGGYRVSVTPSGQEGKAQVRLALGKEEMKRAQKNSENLLMKGWRSRHKTFKKLWTNPWIIEAQERVHPKARLCYPKDWTAEEVDRILLFKIQMAAYRHTLEEKLAGQHIGSISKEIIKNTDAAIGNVRGFKQRHLGQDLLYSRHMGIRGVIQLLTFNKLWTVAGDERARAQFIVDSYILHKILELHIGTPWLAAIPDTERTRPKVALALQDAWETINYTKAVGRKSMDKQVSRALKSLKGNYESCLPAKEIFESPTIACHWSPIGAFLGSLHGADKSGIVTDNKNTRVRTFASENKGLDKTRDGVNRTKNALTDPSLGGSTNNLLYTVPNYRIDASLLTNTNIPGFKAYPKLEAAFQAQARHLSATGQDIWKWLQEGVNARWKLLESSKELQELAVTLRESLDGVADIKWTKASDSNPLDSYLSFTEGRIKQNGKFVERDKAQVVVKRYQDISSKLKALRTTEKSSDKSTVMQSPSGPRVVLLPSRPETEPGGDKLMSAYIAQKMGMELLQAGSLEPLEVLKLMDDTLRALVQLQIPNTYANYEHVRKTLAKENPSVHATDLDRIHRKPLA